MLKRDLPAATTGIFTRFSASELQNIHVVETGEAIVEEMGVSEIFERLFSKLRKLKLERLQIFVDMMDEATKVCYSRDAENLPF